MLRGHGASLQAFSRTVPVGVVGPSGRGTRPCASTCRHGPRPRRTLSAVWKPSSGWRANWRRARGGLVLPPSAVLARGMRGVVYESSQKKKGNHVRFVLVDDIGG